LILHPVAHLYAAGFLSPDCCPFMSDDWRKSPFISGISYVKLLILLNLNQIPNLGATGSNPVGIAINSLKLLGFLSFAAAVSDGFCVGRPTVFSS
jgi:hypothetical protein